jgi:hypothetical protein
MNRFIMFLMAATLAFGAGWLFANEVKPPRYEDISMAMWLIVSVGALTLGGVASAGRG